MPRDKDYAGRFGNLQSFAVFQKAFNDRPFFLAMVFQKLKFRFENYNQVSRRSERISKTESVKISDVRFDNLFRMAFSMDLSKFNDAEMREIRSKMREYLSPGSTFRYYNPWGYDCFIKSTRFPLGTSQLDVELVRELEKWDGTTENSIALGLKALPTGAVFGLTRNDNWVMVYKKISSFNFRLLRASKNETGTRDNPNILLISTIEELVILDAKDRPISNANNPAEIEQRANEIRENLSNTGQVDNTALYAGLGIVGALVLGGILISKNK